MGVADFVLNELIEIEQKYKLLSGDILYQTELFEVQSRLCDMMVKLAGRDLKRNHKLTRSLPYLFKQVEGD